MGRHSFTPYVLNAPGGGNALSILGGHSTNALTTIFGDLPSLSAEVDTLIPEETLADTGLAIATRHTQQVFDAAFCEIVITIGAKPDAYRFIYGPGIGERAMESVDSLAGTL